MPYSQKQIGILILETEHLNLGEALRWCTSQHGEKMSVDLLNSALTLAISTAYMWHLGGNIQEGFNYISRLKVQAQEAGLQAGFLYAKVCNWLGIFTFYSGNNDLARLNFNEAITHFTSMDNKAEICHNLVNLGKVYNTQNDSKEAYRILQESLALANQLGDQGKILRIQGSLGAICTDMGEFSEAKKRLEISLALARKNDEPKEV